jgi:hypothetical protein
MSLSSLLLSISVIFSILVFYPLVLKYLEHRREAAQRFGGIGKRYLAQRITRSRLQWIKADELERMIDADPELVVFHLLDDRAEAAAKRFEAEIGVTLPQLEEALPWIPQGTRFAVYRVGGIAPKLAQRLSCRTQGHQVLLLA